VCAPASSVTRGRVLHRACSPAGSIPGLPHSRLLMHNLQLTFIPLARGEHHDARPALTWRVLAQ
jgi:hypothetical protein